MTFQLIANPISPELRSAVDDLVEGVESGHVVGLGIVVVLKRNRFFVDAFGELVRNPHAGRGLIASLDDCLREIGDRRKDVATTR